jgi:dienelactone hydrolase
VHFTGAAAAQQKIPPVQVAPPGETGRRITEEGLLANYFPAQRKTPAVLALGGSVGGLSSMMNDTSKALQAEGFSVLHLSYYRGPGQSGRIELIPLEYFATALAWLRRQPEADPTRIGIVGASKGAEAALVLAVRHPELKAVIAALPSSVVWPGVVWEGSTAPISSSWSEQGRPVPHLPHVPFDARRGGTTAENYAASLKALLQHPEAVIPVERIAGRVLLVCAEDDRVLPSCPMARQIQERFREHDRLDEILLAYKDAGHAAFGLPLPLDDPRLTSGGGTVQGTNAARSDSWKKAVAFLKANLGH